VGGGEWEFEAQVVPDLGGLWRRIRPPSASYTVLQAEQPGALGHGATTSVVADLHPQQIGAVALDGVGPDLDDRGLGVFGDVGDPAGQLS
jgi:hypothetical protein